MDRRRRKSREAIFAAFSELLSEKNFSKITVGEIIERADVGRATFYSHFETKEFLLKELCEELFCHIFDATNEACHAHRHIFDCDAPDSVFLHLVQHLSRNDNHISDLLSGQNDDLFLRYFKTGLSNLIERQAETFDFHKPEALPQSFFINHVASTFVETIRFWIDRGMEEPPEQITEYFLLAVRGGGSES